MVAQAIAFLSFAGAVLLVPEGAFVAAAKAAAVGAVAVMVNLGLRRKQEARLTRLLTE